MQNAVPSLEHELAGRAVAGRLEGYAGEVRRLLDATYAVMARSGDIDPRVGDIVKEAGLSNQAFYRHFAGKDALLVAVLDEGQRRLVATLERRMQKVEPGAPRVRAWIEGVLEQARNKDAAENTRPFAINAVRLRDRFPTETAASFDRLLAPLRAAVVDAGGDAERDTEAVRELAMGTMHRFLVERRPPTRADVEHVVQFALAGIRASATKGAPHGT
ncbi:MAG TPA: TetR/AcrR family transcriptional regulator [Acidimicrobiia bacterium]|nr:TetR/AcrR family transcriptional regulator [Acidimicrobiia bacterium]